MSSTSFIVLRKIDPPEECYLSEVLFWRAFGRFPQAWFDLEGKPWRFSTETLDSFSAPIPGDIGPSEGELSEEETLYAGLPHDPRMTAMREHGGYMFPENYDHILAAFEDDQNQAEIERYKAERASAVEHFAEVNKWLEQYDEYIDQFQAEICLKLRLGELQAKGTKLPDPDPDLADEILEKDGHWLHDLDVVGIDKERWISQAINWEESAIYGRVNLSCGFVSMLKTC